jgi:hypothetical protein
MGASTIQNQPTPAKDSNPMPATPDDKFLTPSERLANLLARMKADGFDVSEAQAAQSLRGKVAALSDAVLQEKQQSEWDDFINGLKK